jgi:pilus assembly protein CpaE
VSNSLPSETQVLIVAEMRQVGDAIAEALKTMTGLRVHGSASSVSQALTLVGQNRPDVLLIDGSLTPADAIAMIRNLLAQLPDIPIVVVLPQGELGAVQEAILAGARSFITDPFTDHELAGMIRQVHSMDLERRSRLVEPNSTPNPAIATQGQIIAVYGAKGGVGRTSLAVNLAVSLRQITSQPVAIVDASIQFGEVGLLLNVRASRTIMDLLQRISELDAEVVGRVMVSHSSGIKVLLSSAQVELPETIQPEPFRQILLQIQQMFEYVVVDTWPLINETALAIVDTADRVVLVVTPEIACLRNTRLFLELAESFGYSPHKFVTVLNREGARGAISRSEAESVLKRSIETVIPYDESLFSLSINRGVPLVISHPRSPASQALRELAQSLVPGSTHRRLHSQPAEDRTPVRGFGAISTLLRARPNSTSEGRA